MMDEQSMSVVDGAAAVGVGRAGWYRWECHNYNAVPVELELRCPATGVVSRLRARPGRDTRRLVPGDALGSGCRLTVLSSDAAGDTWSSFRRVSRFAAWSGLWSRLRQLDRDFRGLSRLACLRIWLSWLGSRRARESAWRRYERTCHSLPPTEEYSSWLRFESERRLPPDPVTTEGSGRPVPDVRFSFLMPLVDASPRSIQETLDSLRSQSFSDWELCVLMPADAPADIQRELAEVSGQDSRISSMPWARGEDLPTVMNRGVSGLSGDYVALLGARDCLAPGALMAVAQVVRDTPELQLLYSDEDRLTADGERVDPHFKPDWNPDLALAHNYVSRLCVYRRDRLLAMGGFRELVDGGWEHDLLLRFTHGLAPEQIHHIPRVLYHRSANGEDRIGSPAVRAVADYLAEAVPGASAEPSEVPHAYRVHWPLPDPPPLVSLIIPTRDGVDILRPCVDAILERTDYQNLEVLIVDNESRCPETLAYLDDLKRDPRVRVLEWRRPFNFSAINNYAVAQARGTLVGLVNNDIEPINADWLDEMVRQACRPEIGCVGAKLYYPNGRIQHAGVILGIGGVAGHGHKHFPGDHPGYFSRLKLAHNVSAVTAACLLVRRSVFDEVGGLDEENLPVAYNDVDFSLKVREAGYRNLWTPYAEAYHHESVSRGGRDTPEKRRRFEREVATMRARWGRALDNDPAYNPNLTLAHEDFSLR
ncbi:glycosyltransferase family 2 protein [Guyparkeria hydrothermalis]|uniref:glycosyltransferase family 2 protein n=1 Tax=Guyparkeria hydrothermalis TaxID=923 RepID=UPI0020205F77|nr:glycosyltransferase family 2 protein [Guyparkeria hydrothermalis]MCL7745463.1 glycosyltransferase family 2 protein [Guyparkeria hydrothermalis]